MLLGFERYRVNYFGKHAFTDFCRSNLRFTGNWRDFIFRRDLLEEFWNHHGGRKVSPVALGMHLSAAGVKATRLGKEFGQEYGYSGICFVDGRGRKYFPRKRPRRMPKMPRKWLEVLGMLRKVSKEDLTPEDEERNHLTENQMEEEYQVKTEEASNTPPEEDQGETVERDPLAILPTDYIPSPRITSPPSWIEDWKPPVPFTPYELPTPTPTAASSGTQDYNAAVPGIPNTQNHTGALSSAAYKWEPTKSLTYQVLDPRTASHSKIATPSIPDVPIQHLSPAPSPWLSTYMEFIQTDRFHSPNPHIPAELPSTEQSETTPNLLPPPGLHIDFLEQLDIKVKLAKM